MTPRVAFQVRCVSLKILTLTIGYTNYTIVRIFARLWPNPRASLFQFTGAADVAAKGHISFGYNGPHGEFGNRARQRCIAEVPSSTWYISIYRSRLFLLPSVLRSFADPLTILFTADRYLYRSFCFFPSFILLVVKILDQSSGKLRDSCMEDSKKILVYGKCRVFCFFPFNDRYIQYFKYVEVNNLP